MARPTIASLTARVAELEAELARARAAAEVAAVTAAPQRTPSLSLCRAIIEAPPAVQRAKYFERTGAKVASRLDVETWLEEMREAVGLA